MVSPSFERFPGIRVNEERVGEVQETNLASFLLLNQGLLQSSRGDAKST